MSEQRIVATSGSPARCARSKQVIWLADPIDLNPTQCLSFLFHRTAEPRSGKNNVSWPATSGSDHCCRAARRQRLQPRPACPRVDRSEPGACRLAVLHCCSPATQSVIKRPVPLETQSLSERVSIWFNFGLRGSCPCTCRAGPSALQPRMALRERCPNRRCWTTAIRGRSSPTNPFTPRQDFNLVMSVEC